MKSMIVVIYLYPAIRIILHVSDKSFHHAALFLLLLSFLDNDIIYKDDCFTMIYRTNIELCM